MCNYLQANEAKFRRLVESNIIGIVSCDIYGAITEANDEFLQMTSFTREDIRVGRVRWNQITPPELQYLDVLALEELTAKGTTMPYEKALIGKDGRRIPVMVGSALLEDGTENLISFVLDLTARKQAEIERQQLLEQVRSERELLEAVLQQLPAGVMLADASGKIMLSNEQIKHIWRIPALLPFESLDQREGYQGFHADGHPYQQHEWPLFRSVNMGEVVTEEEITFFRGDGTQGVVLVSSAPICDSQGNIKAGVVTLYDISDRKRAEEALRQSERLYRAIGETINYGIWVCEPDGRNIYASESFLRLVGLNQAQCSNFGWGEVLHPDDAKQTMAAWEECTRSGDIWDIEHRFRGVDGNWHPILARGVPVRDQNGEIICWAGINLDISRLKRVEAELRASKQPHPQGDGAFQ